MYIIEQFFPLKTNKEFIVNNIYFGVPISYFFNKHLNYNIEKNFNSFSFMCVGKKTGKLYQFLGKG